MVLEIREIVSFLKLARRVFDRARKIEIAPHVTVLIGGVNRDEKCQDSELGRRKYGSRNRTINVDVPN